MPIGLVAKALGVASKGFTPFSKNMPFSLPSKCMPYDWTSAPVKASIATCVDGVRCGAIEIGRETDAVTYAAVLDLGLAHPLLRRHDAGVLRALDVLVELREADGIPGALPGHRVAGLNTSRHALQRRRGLGLQCRRRGGRRGRHEARGRRDERQADGDSGHLFLTCGDELVVGAFGTLGLRSCVFAIRAAPRRPPASRCRVPSRSQAAPPGSAAENPTSTELSAGRAAPRPVARQSPCRGVRWVC